jgi:hypothetical protein
VDKVEAEIFHNTYLLHKNGRRPSTASPRSRRMSTTRHEARCDGIHT